MVNVLFLLFFPLFLMAVDVKVFINRAIAHKPIEGTIVVTHTQEEIVDATSFLMNSLPLQVLLIDQTTFRFQLPSKAKGLYILSRISVRVNNLTYSSVPTSYEVSQPADVPFLLLETIVPQGAFYPGQRFEMGYRISYNTNIDLKKEELPLLATEAFRKIGGKKIAESQEGDVSIQQITQEFQAVTPGRFDFGASLIESDGMSAEAPPVILELQPFPLVGKPPSFAGALGQYRWNVRMTTPATVNVGDQVEIAFELFGSGDFETVLFPDVACQAGFSGFFEISDLPPIGETQGQIKRFRFEMRPLSALIKEVPPFEFSSFDPISKRYYTLTSAPIPLVVNPLPLPAQPQAPAKPIVQYDWKAILTEASLIKVPPKIIPLSVPNFYLLAYGVALLLLVIIVRHLRNRPVTSRSLLRKAARDSDYSLLEHALLLHLFEKKETQVLIEDPEKLPDSKVRAFLMKLSALRYGKGDLNQPRSLFREARKLFLFLMMLTGTLQGETLAERESTLNQAVLKGSSYDKGNTLFQLSEYSLALLYYERSFQENPYSPHLREQLLRTRKILQIKEELPFTAPSITIRLWILFALGWGAFFFWKPCLLSGAAISLTILYSHFFSPVQAIVMEPSLLYRDSAPTSGIIAALPQGSKVTVLDVQGDLLKVKTEEGAIGFVTSAKII